MWITGVTKWIAIKYTPTPQVDPETRHVCLLQRSGESEHMLLARHAEGFETKATLDPRDRRWDFLFGSPISDLLRVTLNKQYACIQTYATPASAYASKSHDKDLGRQNSYVSRQ